MHDAHLWRFTIKHAVHAASPSNFLSDATRAVPYSDRAPPQIRRALSVVLQSRFAAVMSIPERTPNRLDDACGRIDCVRQ
jgi:hypothetical protein